MNPQLKFSTQIFCLVLLFGNIAFLASAQIRIDGTFVLKKKEKTPFEHKKAPTASTYSDPELSLFRGFTTPPEPLNLDSVYTWIGYPETALEDGLEGKVVVEVLVNTKGKYVKHILKSSSNTVFSTAVEKKIRLLQFEPAKKDNSPVKAWALVPFRFKLHN